MTEDRYQHVRRVFLAARVVALEERAAWLQRECAGDEELRREVEALLEHDRAPAAFIEQPALGVSVTNIADAGPLASLRSLKASAASAAPPESIGRYRLVQKIGAGGMGVVYQAEQENPRRTVALKIIHPHMTSAQTLRRFMQEAQVLGRLQHPGIAQIIEAGTYESGAGSQPFLVMEFVEGETLLHHAESANLGTRDRLKLMVEICDAVDHAHRKGVIHRDLKPGNVLVMEKGDEETERRRDGVRAGSRPSMSSPGTSKILDFGVARLVGADAESITLMTAAHQLVGTVAYMSPEQIRGDANIDARSDVYSLGVMCYELLAGRLPLDVTGCSLAEAARVIQQGEPTRLSSVNTVFRGDIETIVGKAMEKDPARRYASAGELARDMQRFLRDEPIVARPPSTMYQLRKFARRNRGLVVGLAATFVVLLCGLVVSTWLGWRAEQNRQMAARNEGLALRTAYKANIAAAAAAIENHEVNSARRYLEQTDPTLRGWEWRHLRHRLDHSLAAIDVAPLLERPDIGVARFSDDGRSVVHAFPANGAATSLHAWSIADGAPLRTLTVTPTEQPDARLEWWYRQVQSQSWQASRAPGDVIGVPDHGTGAVRDHSLQAWGVPAGAALYTLRFSRDASRAVFAVVRDEEWMEVHAVDVTSDRVLTSIDVQRNRPVRLDISADGTRMVVASNVGATVFETETGRMVAALNEPAVVGSLYSCVALSADGKHVAMGGQDGALFLWSAETGALLAQTAAHRGDISSVAFSPATPIIGTIGGDRTLRLWDAALLAPRAVLHGHQDVIHSLDFSADGARIVTKSGDGTMRIWDAALRDEPDVLHGHTSFVYPVAISGDGTTIASGGWDRTACVWNLADGRLISQCRDHARQVFALALDHTGEHLLTYELHGMVSLWNARTGERMQTASLAAPWLTHLAFDDTGWRALLSWSPQEGSLWWRLSDGALQHDSDMPARVRHPAVSKTARFVVTIARAESERGLVLKVIRRAGGRTMLELSDEDLALMPHAPSFAFSPDEALLAVPTTGHDIVLWDLEDASPRVVLRGHQQPVFAVAFSPDGTRLASGGRDRSVFIWDVAAGEELVQLRGHDSYIWSLAFSPDGATLASGSGDMTVWLWRAPLP